MTDTITPRMATARTRRFPTKMSDRGSGRGVPPAVLLSEALAGDQSAWTELFEEFSPMVTAVVARYRLDHDTTADVCQTVWMRLYEHAAHIQRPEALPGWLATTARNEALRSIRRLNRAQPSGVLDDEVDLTTPSPDEQAVDAETLDDVLTAFGRLPDDSKQLLRLLVATPPLPYSDIAARVGRPVGSIGPTRSRCLDVLRSHLADHGRTVPIPIAA